MIKRLFEQVINAISDDAESGQSPQTRDDAIRLATAVLMVDVAQADDVFDETEFNRVLALIEKHFKLQPQLAAELLNEASEKADELVSLHSFTDTLHRHLAEHEKARIVELLWQVAYADGRLDKYEDSLVLKISDLLHVSRGAVMRLKDDASRATGEATRDR